MIDLLKKQRASSVLGLTLDGNRLEAVVLRRSVGALQLQQTATAALALSPLGGDPELVGREIRNHLDQAGIRERRCVVGLPLSWVLTLQVKVPDLPEADIEGFLQIEAERGFTSGHENLFIAAARARVQRMANKRHLDGHSAEPSGNVGEGPQGGAAQAAQFFPGHRRLGRWERGQALSPGSLDPVAGRPKP